MPCEREVSGVKDLRGKLEPCSWGESELRNTEGDADPAFPEVQQENMGKKETKNK